MVATKAKALLLETLAQNPLKSENSILPEEKKWMETYVFRDRNKNIVRHIKTPGWRLQDTNANFQEWWKKQGKATIFFYGASKWNPGIAEASGVIYSQDDTRRELQLGAREENKQPGRNTRVAKSLSDST